MAQDLARLGASLPQIQAAGRWKGPQMPADYIRSISSGHSAVAKFEEFPGMSDQKLPARQTSLPDSCEHLARRIPPWRGL